jgi:short-subunit dehydrogenase
MKKQVWFITGCSSGLGKSFAINALEAGHHVVATARNLDSLNYLPSSDNLLKCKLDVTQSHEIRESVQKTIEKFGKIDVLVNNAGYGLEGAFEELTMQQILEQFQTNVFGLMELTQSILPILREQKSGYIFNISSIAGLRGIAGMSIYNASKFAVTGFSEALANELEPFGIHVVAVAPGPYRTDWAGRSLKKSENLKNLNPASPYYELNKKIHTYMTEADGNQPGSPDQIASILLCAAQKNKLPVHMIFGQPAIDVWNKKMEKYQSRGFIQFFPHEQYQF